MRKGYWVIISAVGVCGLVLVSALAISNINVSTISTNGSTKLLAGLINQFEANMSEPKENVSVNVNNDWVRLSKDGISSITISEVSRGMRGGKRYVVKFHDESGPRSSLIFKYTIIKYKRKANVLHAAYSRFFTERVKAMHAKLEGKRIEGSVDEAINISAQYN